MIGNLNYKDLENVTGGVKSTIKGYFATRPSMIRKNSSLRFIHSDATFGKNGFIRICKTNGRGAITQEDHRAKSSLTQSERQNLRKALQEAGYQDIEINRFLRR